MEKEYKKQEYKIELKMVAILSVNHINEIKEKIPKIIEKGLHYNFEYCKEKDGNVVVGNRNSWRFIALQISDYDTITQEEKDWVNNIIVPSRQVASFPTNNTDIEREEEQIKKYAKIWKKQEKDLEDSFINTQICKEVPFKKRR